MKFKMPSISVIVTIIIITLLLSNSRIFSDASCTDDQVKTCQQTVDRKGSKTSHMGECSVKQYVHFTHICSVNNYVPGLDFCCCQIPGEMDMCCRYHQHWNVYRCVQDKDTFFSHGKNHVSFYLITSTEILLPVILLPAAIFIFWLLCCCLFRVNSCRRQSASSPGNCDPRTEVASVMRRSKSQEAFQRSCCCGQFSSCGYELAQDLEWTVEGNMFPKRGTIETNNNEYLPHKMTFDPRVQSELGAEEELAFYQSDAENNNLSISCIEVLSRMEQKRAEDCNIDESRLGHHQQQQHHQQQHQQFQEKPQNSFLDCLPYNFILLKPSSHNPQRFNQRGCRSVAHVRPTVYKHSVPDNGRSPLTTSLNLLKVSYKSHPSTDNGIPDLSNFEETNHSSSILNLHEHEPLSFEKQLHEQDISNI